MMKKYVFLAFLLSVTASAFAVEAEINGLCYDLLLKAKEAKVIKYKNLYSGNIVIPETVEYDGTVYSVTSIGNGAFRDCHSLISITIPSSITNIGSDAFNGCYSLTTVNISDLESWCKISFNGSFSYASSHHLFLNGEEIKDLIIPNKVMDVGDEAFRKCSSLNSVTIPSSVMSIGNRAFQYCSGLTSITIQDGVKSLGNAAFEGCSSVTSVMIPGSITYIGDASFYECSNLSSVTIQDGVKSIGNSAFNGCRNLLSVTIPSSL